MIKTFLIAIYEEIYSSELILGRIYERRNNKLNIMNAVETLKYAKKEECSIARLGEGELELILDPKRNLGFQKCSRELTERLEEVLMSADNKCLICIPHALNSIRGGRTKHSRMFWHYWMNYENQGDRIIRYIQKGKNRRFGDTQITRPYVAYKNSKNASKIFPMLKELWKEKHLIIVEGSQTRLGIGNDLFDGAKSIKRVIAPPENAFDFYDEIKRVVLDIYNGELIILALGPTATVLAYDFAKQGKRALDLGHVDIEYEWYTRGSKSHDVIVGKYTNEAAGGDIVKECEDEKYKKQIVARIGCVKDGMI